MVEGKTWSLSRDWIHTIYFDAYFEDALTKMKASTGLGSTYALFTALNEYFHEWGYMGDKGYRYHKKRYGKALVDEFEHLLELRDNVTRQEIKGKQLEIEALTKQLSSVVDQWPTMKPKARKYYLDLAKTHPELPDAQKILEKTNNDVENET